MLKRTVVRGGVRAAALAAVAGLAMGAAALPAHAVAVERVAFGDAAPWLCTPADETDEEAKALDCHKKRALSADFRARTLHYFVDPPNTAAADAARADAVRFYQEAQAATTAVAAAQAAAKVAEAANRITQLAVAKTPEALKQGQDAAVQTVRSSDAATKTTPPARDVDANNQADSDEEAAVFLMEAAGWIIG
ncbi:hypothetical protein [Streptomyces finlayi]|uniref:hypothetical protein n=1 Tax=Streptomyces finlayi TaxID=67296 RepID=UPI001672F059|nr:hypothetical protein [Streptomyces finlayi]